MVGKGGLQFGDLVDLRALERSASPVFAELELTNGAPGNTGALADRIERSESLSAWEVAALAGSIHGAMENMKVDYFGDELTMVEFLAIPDLDKNSKICKEIEAGDYADAYHDGVNYLPMRVADILIRKMSVFLNLRGLRFLPNEMAAKIAVQTCLWLDMKSLTLANVTEIVNSGLRCTLKMHGPGRINKEIAELLGNYEGGLSLLDFDELSVEEAEGLAKSKCGLEIGLKVLTPDLLWALLKHPNDLDFPSLDPKLLEEDVLQILVENDYDPENDGYEIVVGDEVRKMMEDYKSRQS